MKRRMLLIGGAWIAIPWTIAIAQEQLRRRALRASGAGDAAEDEDRPPPKVGGPGPEA